MQPLEVEKLSDQVAVDKALRRHAAARRREPWVNDPTPPRPESNAFTARHIIDRCVTAVTQKDTFVDAVAILQSAIVILFVQDARTRPETAGHGPARSRR